MENNLIKDAIDPICGMRVGSTSFSATYNDRTYSFCSQGCKDKFEAEIGQYKKESEYDLVIIATGMKRRKLGMPGEERLLRRGVLHSALQDASLFAGKHVVVVGGGNSGVQTARGLLQSGCHVTLAEKANITADPSELELLARNPDFEVLDQHDVTEIYGEDKVEGVEIQSLGDLTRRHIACSGIFVQVGLIPNTEFCLGLLKLNEKGEIKIKPDCSTNVQGIFACGDVTEVFAKIIIIASG